MATPTSDAVATTGIDYIDGILQGSCWTFSGSDRTLTYSFWDTGSGALDAEQQAQVTAALTTISNVCNLSFELVSPSSGTYYDNTSDISVRFYSDDDVNTYAYQIFPDPDYVDGGGLAEEGSSRADWPTAEGDESLNIANASIQETFDTGSETFLTIIHEMGHGLGLKHPFDDESGAGLTYESLGIPEQDLEIWSVMSYDEVFEPGAATGKAATPSINDIAALQYIYGTNTSYNAGDTTYTLSDDSTIRTYWDAGGSDTFDASAMTSRVSLFLDQATQTTLGDQTLAMIAYGTTIENAIGGLGEDTIAGNSATNALSGGSGDDTLSGLDGDDVVFGNVDDDLLFGNAGADTLYGGQNGDTLYGGQDGDLLFGNLGSDRLVGNLGGDIAYGGQGDDVAFGGDGNDSLFGNLGDDTLHGDGGDDLLSGGDGADVFYFETSSGNDTVADFTTSDALLIRQEAVAASNTALDQFLIDNATTDADGNAVIHLEGGSITLTGFSVANLTTGLIDVL